MFLIQDRDTKDVKSFGAVLASVGMGRYNPGRPTEGERVRRPCVRTVRSEVLTTSSCHNDIWRSYPTSTSAMTAMQCFKFRHQWPTEAAID